MQLIKTTRIFCNPYNKDLAKKSPSLALIKIIENLLRFGNQLLFSKNNH